MIAVLWVTREAVRGGGVFRRVLETADQDLFLEDVGHCIANQAVDCYFVSDFQVILTFSAFENRETFLSLSQNRVVPSRMGHLQD